MTVPSSSRIGRREAVVFTELDDVIVMLDTDAGGYYELDAVGSRIWSLLECEPTIADLQAALTDEFDVDGDTCRTDLLAFVEELGELRLVDFFPSGAVQSEGEAKNEQTKQAHSD